MVALGKRQRVFTGKDRQLYVENEKKWMAYQKGAGIFVFNFHPTESYTGCFVPVPEAGTYKIVMSTDDFCFGGFGRVYHQTYETVEQNGQTGLLLYLPSRTAFVLEKI